MQSLFFFIILYDLLHVRKIKNTVDNVNNDLCLISLISYFK